MGSLILKSGRIWDLHIHSNQCSSAPPRMKALGVPKYIDGLLDVFILYRDLDMISFTDHNSISAEVYNEFLSRQTGIRLLPGVEVDTQLEEGEASKHLIVYFDAVDDADKIGVLSTWANAALSGVGPNNPMDIDVLLNKLLELRMPFVLSPHAMKQGKRGFEYDWHCLDDPSAEARKYIDQFFCFWETGGKSSIAHAVEFLREVDAAERVSVISFSDSKDYDKLEDYLKDPPQYFWALPTFRGLQMVGSDAHRITKTKEEIPDNALGSYLGEVCFDGQSIELSSRLNAVIGGRGSGKSLLLDGLSLALGDPNGLVSQARADYLRNHDVVVKSSRGDTVSGGSFAYDYFNQSYVAKLFLEEGDAYKEALTSYFATGFDSVAEIDEAGVKARNMEMFVSPVAERQAGELENISGLVDKYAIDRDDALDAKINKKQRQSVDKKIAKLDYEKLAADLDKVISSKMPPAIIGDEDFKEALVRFKREVLVVAGRHRRSYLCGPYLQNELVDEFLRVKGEISEAQKAKASAARQFDVAFQCHTKDILRRVSIVNAYIGCAVGFQTRYESSSLKDGARPGAFRFKKTLDVEHPLRHMLALFSEYFLAEKAGKGGYDEFNLANLIERFCYDESGYKKGKDWSTLTEELRKFELEYRAGASIEYLGDDGIYRDIATMSPGTQTNILLEYIVHMDTGRPLLIDQPEDNVDNQTIFTQIKAWFVKLKHDRQVIVVTHDANIVINADAENVVIAEQPNPGEFSYVFGALESDGLIDRASLILDGGREAVKRRLMKYGE